MAGWSKTVVDDDDDRSGSEKSLMNPCKTGTVLDNEPDVELSVKIEHEQQDDDDDDNKKVKNLFNEFLTSFYKEFYGPLVLRPLPPLLGDGKSVDLLKLFLTVREKGGYEEVSGNGMWGSVAKECGIDSRVISDLKLVYVKYLDLLDKWLKKIVKDKDSKSGVVGKMTNFGEVLMDLELGLKGVWSKILNKKKIDGVCLNSELKSELNLLSDGEMCNPDKHFGVVESNGAIKNVEEKRVVVNGNEGGFDNVEVNASVDNNDVRSMDIDSQQRKIEKVENYDVVKENEISRKRKRECYSSVIKWITEAAKDPCDPAIGLVPERSRWRSYGNGHIWKQVLLVREAMLIRKNADSSTQQFIWQNKQMHPAMYEDSYSSERLRSSQRLVSAKEPVNKSSQGIFTESSSSATDEETSDSSADSKAGFWVNSYRQKRVRRGQNHQADVPEWNGEIQESDSKWVGSRIWPLDMSERNKHLIERERIGKGRQDSCGCPCPGSIECIRFHVAEKKMRVKLELGTAYHMLKFNNMGEEVALSWTKEEEEKFQDIVKSNPLSLGKCFWNELLKCFPGKGREALVRYYFNVFLLRQRANQNRISPSNIDSDDDEAELGSDGVKPPHGSTYSSPKKVHLNFR